MKKTVKFHLLMVWVLISFLSFSCREKPVRILIPGKPASAEKLAAAEIRRYLYLRTGELPEIVPVGAEAASSCGKTIRILSPGDPQVPAGLEDEELWLKTENIKDGRELLVSGGSGQAVLYAAYELARQLGIRFYLHGDVIPDKKMKWEMPELDIRQKPLFNIRGIQPFHDFPEGPDWWNPGDYTAIIGQLPKLKMNFIGFHTYPYREKFDGGGPKAEPLVWIGKEDEVNSDGTVNTAYPVLHFNTNDSTWGYFPVKTSSFPLGGSQIFETDHFGTDYMKNVTSWPHTPEENLRIFNESGKMFGDVFTFARKLGVKTCVGTETTLVIPAPLKERMGITIPADEQVKMLYRGMFTRIMKIGPPDYYWLWTPEGWTWEGVSGDVVKKTEHDMQLARQVLQEMGNPFQLATCGWVLGPPGDRARFDRVLPKDMPFSCINRGVGYTPVEKGFNDISGRPKWSIPWMEDDPDLIATQLWVGRLLKDALDSKRYGCDGLIGIHWRTRDLSPNVSALARAAWIPDKWESVRGTDGRDLNANAFYVDFIRTEFGLVTPKLWEIFSAIDSKGSEQKEGYKGDSPLNASDWILGPGALMVNRSQEDLTGRISGYGFLDYMDSLRVFVTGKGNLERYDYWLNSLRFNKAILETALEIRKFRDLMTAVKNEPDNERQQKMAIDTALPVRINMARKWEEMTQLLLARLSTTGEMGILANLEMHNGLRLGYLTGQDEFLKDLGVTIPAEAFPAMNYTGKTRIIVTAAPSILEKGKDFTVRVRVLSETMPVKGTFFRRPLGGGRFSPLELKNLARNVFEISVPANDITGDFEYYITVEDGKGETRYPATSPEINGTTVII